MHFIGILWDLTMPKWDCIPLQRCVIEGVFDRLNQEQREMLLEGAHGRRTALNSVVKGYKEEMMKDKKLPSPRTIRRWINCYLLYGETPEESKRKTGKRKRQSRWAAGDTTILREIVTEHPYLFLDEIQSRFSYRTGKWFSGKTIYRHMKIICFSLKVAYEVASQRDEEERAAWRLFLMQLGENVQERLILSMGCTKG